MDNDYALSILALLDEGMDEETARSTLGRFPEITATLAPAQRAKIEGDIRAREERERLNSPEGRIERAEQMYAEHQKREALADRARFVLVADGELDAETVASLDTTDVLRAAGLEATPYGEMSMPEKDAEALSIIGNGSYARMPFVDRLTTAHALNGSVEAFDQAATDAGYTIADSPAASGGEGEGGDGGDGGGDS